MSQSEEMAVTAPFAGVVVAIPYGSEEPVGAGTAVVVLEAMKMEHEVLAEADGVVARSRWPWETPSRRASCC